MQVISGYGLAVVLTASALGVSFFLQQSTHYRILFPFFAAVIISGWHGGRGPAWLSVILTLLAVDYFFGTPLYSWAVSDSDQTFFVPFAVVTVIAGWVSSLRLRSHRWMLRHRAQVEANALPRVSPHANAEPRVSPHAPVSHLY
jgi:K+-sensing histidine kinase KdpD